MARQSRSDSVTSQVQAKQDIHTVVDVPAGIKLKSDEERTLWAQFTQARSPDSWRDFDLVLVYKLVKLEADIRMYQAQIDGEATIENKRGTLVMNPLLNVVDQLERRQLSIVRTLSLGAHADVARSKNNTGVRSKAKREAEKKTESVVQLLA